VFNFSELPSTGSSSNYSKCTLPFNGTVHFKMLLVLLSLLLKDDCKILVSFEQIRNFEVSNFAMAKVKKVNIAVTYSIIKG
jgi:hypothetical protein